MNRFLTKISEYHPYAHVTSDYGLDRILESGRINHIKNLVAQTPDIDLNVEPSHIPSMRRTMAAKDAYEAMKDTKVIDKIFLTRNGYLPNYGDNIIVKHLSSPKKRISFNSIPEEYTVSRPLSVKTNAVVYVPNSKLKELREKYKGVSFKAKEDMPLKSYNLVDRAYSLPLKTMEALGIIKNAYELHPKKVGSTAFIGGSNGLGINVDNSDIDIFVPYAHHKSYLKAVDRIKSRYPELVERASTLKNPYKTTLTGVINGKDIDVVIGSSHKAIAYKNAYQEALLKLTDKKREEIKKTKLALKNSWILPNLRYKMYKDQLSKELGLKDNYF